MIHMGAVMGGGELADSPIRVAIRKIARARGPKQEDESGSLGIVFHGPGSILGNEFAGVRTGMLSRSQRMLQVRISAPEEQVEAPDDHWLLERMREAIRIARPRFERARIGYPEAEYLATIDRVEQGLAP
ncbi:hypothetical protein [Myxococcus fulvus]|uniref:hypothetical protein n=1 Tax=Myxococcus TaxID=32 RepID=UPI0020C07F24|nr:hypothetical protein [Myxococcus fulvus]MCK8500833.1 hypothetical protein [Myxococcus fulvus]